MFCDCEGPTKNLARAREIPIWCLIILDIAGTPEMNEAIGIVDFSGFRNPLRLLSAIAHLVVPTAPSWTYVSGLEPQSSLAELEAMAGSSKK